MSSDRNDLAHWHAMRQETVLSELATTIQGLTEKNADELLRITGPNALKEPEKQSLLSKFISQFKNVMVLILLAAAAVSGLTHELTDALVIFIVILINAVMGVIQENKAEKALDALKAMSSPTAKVIRDGKTHKIQAHTLVPGDIVLLEAGDSIPADIRLLENASLKTEEASLTGESLPVEKDLKLLEKDTALAERSNMVYMGTQVTYGRGKGVVVQTGMKTEVGHIAEALTRAETQTTPLQQKLAEIGKYLSIIVLALSLLIFAAGLLRGYEIKGMFLTSVSLAVAAIPEGLPAIVTIVLALGVQVMSKHNAIIRKLPAVETLGCTQVICSDKTGTLTKNKMTVTTCYTDESIIKAENRISSESWELMISAMVLCNDAEVYTENNTDRSFGDPTEIALIELGEKAGFKKSKLLSLLPRVAEIPFDSERKRMSTIHESDKGYYVFVKGAVDTLLSRCTKIQTGDKIYEITEKHLGDIRSANSKMASGALRVLACAYKTINATPNKIDVDNIEQDLIFLGLTGMIDPPREEVKDAVKLCRSAGIRPVMITGDHMDTARAIALDLGLLDQNGTVISGMELDAMTEEELDENVTGLSVYARVSPEHKVRIVRAWQKLGNIVAMTGDGVNDAPALKKADIGIGMGITGTDVSKGVSDMVLTDDNFATIIEAVREGRRIYSNIRKSVQFLLSANISEVVTMFVAIMLGWPILYPIQILWINLVTDTFPALALGMEKAEPDVMRLPPRKANQSVFADGIGFSILYQGILQGLLTLGVYFVGLSTFRNGDIARTMAFVTLGLIQLIHTHNVRSNKKSLFSLGLISNRWLVLASAGSILLHIGVSILPFTKSVFKLSSLSGIQLFYSVLGSILILPLVEIFKLFIRINYKNAKRSPPP